MMEEPFFGTLFVFMAERKRAVTDTLSPQPKMTHATAACNLLVITGNTALPNHKGPESTTLS